MSLAEWAYSAFSGLMVGLVIVCLFTLIYEILVHAIKRQRQRKFKKWNE